MRVTANRQMRALVHANFHHSRFRIEQVLGSLDNLERILAMNALPGLKPLNHIIDKLLRHLAPQPDAIIAIIDPNSLDIQLLKRRRRIRHLNSLLKLQPAHQLLALGELQLRIAVIRLPLNDSFEILKRLFVVEDSGIRKRSSPIRLVDIRTVFSLSPYNPLVETGPGKLTLV